MTNQTLNIAQAAQTYGITQRQLGHAITRGYLTLGPGQRGKQRQLDPQAQNDLKTLIGLVNAGFRWEQAATVLRRLETNTTTTINPGGVVITITKEQ